MIDIARIPDDVIIQTEGGRLIDATIRFESVERKLNVYLKATEDHPCFVLLRWNEKNNEPLRVLGDKWERAYADLEWRSLSSEIFMPWYFMVTNGTQTTGCGVMVQPNSFVSFEYDASGVCAWFDVRCGSKGVHLNGRELLIGTVVCETYSGMTPFEATEIFCGVMCPNPVLPREPVYGSNNWYYAYGKSSYEEIIADVDFLTSLTSENNNRPYMVIDDGWEENSCSGPWSPNAKYRDMEKIAREFKEKK